MRKLQGTPASSGVARGPAVRLEMPSAPSGHTISQDEVEAEIRRLGDGQEAAGRELAELAERLRSEGRDDESEIFGAQAAMARDPALRSLAETNVKQLQDAVGAILDAGEAFADQLRNLDDELLASRAGDVLDVADRIARRVTGLGDPAGPALSAAAIVVAADLSPSATAMLPRDRLLGLALESGSATSHAAILARAFGIPAVVGTVGLLVALEAVRQESGGTSPEMILDGGSGEIFIAPDRPTSVVLDRRRKRERREAESAVIEASRPAVTRDGCEVKLQANIGSAAEVERAIELGAEGIGLFRTEFLFFERPLPPSEAEQLAAYRSAIEASAPRPVTIRLIDVGGDKPLPYLSQPPEGNPFLGVRGLRLASTHPDLFIGQLRAAMRAAAGSRVRVMAPMVADAADVDLFLELAARASAELDARGERHGQVELGVMIEVPSAALTAASYLSRLSFVSLGTNDLLQYALAVDRGNHDLAHYHDPLHPALLCLVSHVIEHAADARVEVSVCGEMAGEPSAALLLIGLGVRTLSMSAASLPHVRRAIRAARLSELQTLARDALRDGSAADVRARLAGQRAPRETVERLRPAPRRVRSRSAS